MVKQQCHRTQGSKHQAVKRRVKENSEVFSKFSVVFFLFMEKRNKGIPLCQGKSSLTPLQQLSCPLTSTWLARSSRLLSPAVKCPLVWHQALRSQPEFSVWKPSHTSHLLSSVAWSLGKQGWHWGLARVWAQIRAALAGLPGCGTGWGDCGPSPALAPTLPHKDTGSRAAPALLTLPHQVVSPSHSTMKLHLLLAQAEKSIRGTLMSQISWKR